jgi:hypothetical protein
MSTAILYSGQLRTFAQCYPTQRWHVLRHVIDPHFFFTIQDQPDVDAILAPLIADYGADRVHVQRLTDPDLTADLTPQLSAAYHQAPYANAAPAHQLLLQHWYQSAVWAHFERLRPRLSAFQFTSIIRLRPDLWFHSFESERATTVWADEVLTPWWGRFGGLNDRFAIMGPAAAAAYFDIYAKIPELLGSYQCPFHPETLLAARLEIAQVHVTQTLRAEFSTLRANGQARPPEISSIDLAHAALR